MSFYYHWVDTSAVGLLVPVGIARLGVSASTLCFDTDIVYYIYFYINLQFLNVKINKTKVLLPLAYLGDFS